MEERKKMKPDMSIKINEKLDGHGNVLHRSITTIDYIKKTIEIDFEAWRET